MNKHRLIGYVGVVMLGASVLLGSLQGMPRAQGKSSWLRLDSEGVALFETAAGLVLIACWVDSIVVWAKPPRDGASRFGSLIGLILFGVFVGPLYILLSSRGRQLAKTSDGGSRV